jgi:hypothetical protein
MIVRKGVSLIAYGNKSISRVLVAVENEYLFVCKREELEAAIREDRDLSVSASARNTFWKLVGSEHEGRSEAIRGARCQTSGDSACASF